MSKKVDADDYQGNLSQTYRDLLHDAQMKAAREQRTNSEKLSLFLRKVVGFSQYLLVQGVSFVLIIAVSLEAANISVEISKSFPGVRLFVDLANLNTSLTHSLTHPCDTSFFYHLLQFSSNLGTRCDLIVDRHFYTQTDGGDYENGTMGFCQHGIKFVHVAYVHVLYAQFVVVGLFILST